MTKSRKIIFSLVFVFVFAVIIGASYIYAEPIEIPNIDVKIGDEGAGLSSTIQVIIVLTILAIAPSILLMMTSFTRILIIFSFLRRALSLQATPPNQVLIGLSLFLTFYIMAPVFTEVYVEAYEPLVNQEITQEEAFDKAMTPMKKFMIKNVRTNDLALFIKISDSEPVEDISEEDVDQVSAMALIPAFVISELKTAFIVGFMLFIPFIIIDMVVASTLMALGMMMLPPVMVSMPFKLLLFIMVDGWNLITGAVVKGFGL